MTVFNKIWIRPTINGQPDLGIDQHRLVRDVEGTQGVLDAQLEVEFSQRIAQFGHPIVEDLEAVIIQEESSTIKKRLCRGIVNLFNYYKTHSYRDKLHDSFGAFERKHAFTTDSKSSSWFGRRFVNKY